MPTFVPGQRWASAAEPELGLGTVVRLAGRSVQILFAGAGVLRQYAVHSAPLVRAEFREGDEVSGNGIRFVVEQASEEDGLLVYSGGGHSLPEGALDDQQSVSGADRRLLTGELEPVELFRLRLEALSRRAAARRRASWGMNPARIELLPHQLAVVARACARRAPRVLLADEVGLGKTIEAGLIVSRKLATGEARRVLVVVPDNLVHQWFVEFLRRFNLGFALFDAARLAAGQGGNAFEDVQYALVGREWLLATPAAEELVLAASWDILVVDEAHHLHWTPEDSGPAYRLIEQLAARIPSVVLLTATPEQAGARGHFARLRLLDPVRFSDLDAYLESARGWVALSGIADRLAAGADLSPDDRELLRRRYPEDADLADLLAGGGDGSVDGARLLSALIDRHGPGRVMFRNRRDLVGGFPERILHLADLGELPADASLRQALLAEFDADVDAAGGDFAPDYAQDPRLAWLRGLLEAHPRDKFLLICRSQSKVEALDRLFAGGAVRHARFHEGLGLLQRDRNAAWFAEADGAQLLLASEIGSEGRNFQFAQHLVLWDLPLDPDLLEQRIGRLDRIGRGEVPVHIHVARLRGSAQEILLRWHHEGLDSLRATPADGRSLVLRFGSRVTELARAHALAQPGAAGEIEALLEASRTASRELAAAVHAGRDRLLELAARRGEEGELLAEELRAADADDAGRAFIERLFEHFGVQLDDLGGGVLRLDPEYLTTDGLGGFGDEPFSATHERGVALHRDELPLLRLEHPLVLGALDLLLGSSHGNAAAVLDPALPGRQLLLQALFVVECVADAGLDVQRFLPAQPLVLTTDSALQDRAGYEPGAEALLRATRHPLEVRSLRGLLERVVPPMLDTTRERATARAGEIAAQALAEAEARLGRELERLAGLQRINPLVGEPEIAAASAELAGLREALPKARVRLDALLLAVSPALLSRG